MNKVTQAAPELYDAMKKAGLIEEKRERGPDYAALSGSASETPKPNQNVADLDHSAGRRLLSGSVYWLVIGVLFFAYLKTYMGFFPIWASLPLAVLTTHGAHFHAKIYLKAAGEAKPRRG